MRRSHTRGVAPRGSWRTGLVTLGAVLAVEAAVLAAGAARLRMAPGAGESIRVGVAASDPDVPAFRADRREQAMPVVAAYARRVRDLASRGAQLVVLPEKMVGIAPSYRDEAQAVLAAAARDASVRLVAGVNLTGADPRRNVAWVFGPDGRMELEYEKRLLVPHFENGYDVGVDSGLVATDAGLAARTRASSPRPRGTSRPMQPSRPASRCCGRSKAAIQSSVRHRKGCSSSPMHSGARCCVCRPGRIARRSRSSTSRSAVAAPRTPSTGTGSDCSTVLPSCSSSSPRSSSRRGEMLPSRSEC